MRVYFLATSDYKIPKGTFLEENIQKETRNENKVVFIRWVCSFMICTRRSHTSHFTLIDNWGDFREI